MLESLLVGKNSDIKGNSGVEQLEVEAKLLNVAGGALRSIISVLFRHREK